jgi:hypothetical protein
MSSIKGLSHASPLQSTNAPAKQSPARKTTNLAQPRSNSGNAMLDGLKRAPSQKAAPQQTSLRKSSPPVGEQQTTSPTLNRNPGDDNKPPHTVGNVQDFAKSIFGMTTGVSPKVIKGSESAEMQALRKQPATPETMTRLSELEHQYANAPGDGTMADKIAASAGFARHGAAHVAASTAAMGAGGLPAAHQAGYLGEQIENITTNF